jgi:hypothetical protein
MLPLRMQRRLLLTRPPSQNSHAPRVTGARRFWSAVPQARERRFPALRVFRFDGPGDHTRPRVSRRAPRTAHLPQKLIGEGADEHARGGRAPRDHSRQPDAALLNSMAPSLPGGSAGKRNQTLHPPR